MRALALSVVLLVPVLVLGGCLGTAPPVRAGPEGRVLSLRARTPDGVPVALGGAQGVRLVGFFASWCDECAPLVARWQGLARRQGVRLDLVSVDADLRLARRWAEEAGIRRFLWDPGGRSAEDEVRLERVPSLLVVDAGGRVRFVESGYARGADQVLVGILEEAGGEGGASR